MCFTTSLPAVLADPNDKFTQPALLQSVGTSSATQAHVSDESWKLHLGTCTMPPLRLPIPVDQRGFAADALMLSQHQWAVAW